jgi:sRNA-binding carbon storage regulator CsrA
VYVDKIVGSRVWIGITAPKEMRIDRREVTIQRMMADKIPLNEIEQRLDAAEVQP